MDAVSVFGSTMRDCQQEGWAGSLLLLGSICLLGSMSAQEYLNQAQRIAGFKPPSANSHQVGDACHTPC